MSQATLPGGSAPNYRTPRLFGILNIVFASGIMICGLCMGMYLMVLPTLGKAMDQVTKEAQKKIDEQKKQELAALQEEAKAAKTEQEKSDLEARRKEIESRPNFATVGTMDFSKFMSDPLLIGWYWVEILTGLLLNGLMMASGIGLLKFRGWARNLGVQVGIAKIVRLVLVYGFFTISIVPPMCDKLGDMVSEMMAQQQKAMGKPMPGAPGKDLFVKTYMVMYTGMGIGTIVVGSIYPALLIWFLTRPGVVAACPGAGSKPKPESSDTW
jgi:hypothetical protein